MSEEDSVHYRRNRFLTYRPTVYPSTLAQCRIVIEVFGDHHLFVIHACFIFTEDRNVSFSNIF